MVRRLRNPTTCYPVTEDKETDEWQCIVCGWIYDEAEGYEDEGIVNREQRGNDVREDFICPECGAGKRRLFEMIEIG